MLIFLSADVNPIGAISKTDLKKFIHWAETALELPILKECVLRSIVSLR
jgi:NAD+ synthase (glutamine-hydrolysing)